MNVKRLRSVVGKWYEGEFIMHENPPDTSVFIVGGTYKRHWTARFARALVTFHTKEWKWALPFYLAVAALIIRR